jgi:hypothetical protein
MTRRLLIAMHQRPTTIGAITLAVAIPACLIAMNLLERIGL